MVLKLNNTQSTINLSVGGQVYLQAGRACPSGFAMSNFKTILLICGLFAPVIFYVNFN